MIAFPKPYADAVARLRVPFGFLLVAVFAWFSNPTAASLAAGLPVSLAGLALRAWAAGCLAKNRQLATGGPYAYTRNPLYLGTLLVAAGLAAAARSLWLAVLFAAVFALIYLPVIQLEEQHLRKLFPEYAAYADRVPAILPGFRGTGIPACVGFDLHADARAVRPSNPFTLSLYLRNQEYQAAAGFIAGMLFLLWKVLR
jgi:protein-S-isoprenylcysteine O-methyltransferase Ste14